jgi:NAD(P)-dependent dehydrogenase (short-subunit alcohol dehydrogenase family)
VAVEDLSGKVGVVTGGASGIGLATGRALAEAGARVVLADIEQEALDAAVAALTEEGHDVIGVRCDVSDSDDVEALAARAFDHFGGVHVVHLNAGVAAGGPAWTLSEKDWAWVLGVNLWGVIHGIRAFVPRMIEQGEPAHVVATASMAGLTSSAFMAAYNVSKHGVVTLAETLKRDLSLVNAPIGVSVLCPGWVNTGIGESGRNRPTELRNVDGPNLLEGGDASPLKAVLEAGLAPAAVADMVVEAIRTDRFYILTHDDWQPMVAQRMTDILEGRTPSPMFLPT